MKKHLLAVMLGGFCFILLSCATQQNGQVIVEDEIMLSPDDHFTYTAESMDENTLFYCDNLLYSETHTSDNVLKMELPIPHDAWLWGILGDDICFFNPSKNAICSLSLDGQIERVLVQLESGHQAALMANNPQYLVWIEASSDLWLDGTLHLYDIESNADKVIFEYPLDENGVYYTAFISPCAIFEEKVYFDCIEHNSDSPYMESISVYAYDIHSQELLLAGTNAQHPFINNGSINWLQYNTEKEVGSLHSPNLPCQYYMPTDGSVSIWPLPTGNGLAVYEYLYAPTTAKLFGYNLEEMYGSIVDQVADMTDSYAIRYISQEGLRPIMVTREPIGSIIGNQYGIAWSCTEFPRYYDIRKNAIINIDSIPNGEYTCVVTDNRLIYSTFADSSIIFYSIPF